MADTSVAALAGVREPMSRPDLETKAHAQGEQPLGVHGEQWRVVHAVADRRLETVQRRVQGAITEAREQIVLADLIAPLERRDTDAVMRALPSVEDTSLQADMQPLMAEMVAEVAQDTGLRLTASVVDVLADKATTPREFKQTEPSVEEQIARAELAISDELAEHLNAIASFTATNPRAVEYARSEAASLVTSISEETRRAIRGRVTAAFERGVPPRKLARQIRDLDFGLTRRQSAAVDNFRQALESGDASTIAAQTERRLDAAQQQRLRSAARQGRVPADLRDELVGRYSESMRNRRALNVARTETIDASVAGQQKAWEEAIDREVLDRDRSRKVWIITPDSRLCSICAPIPSMNTGGVKVNEGFETPVGTLMGPTAHPSCRCATGMQFTEGPAVRREA